MIEEEVKKMDTQTAILVMMTRIYDVLLSLTDPELAANLVKMHAQGLSANPPIVYKEFDDNSTQVS